MHPVDAEKQGDHRWREHCLRHGCGYPEAVEKLGDDDSHEGLRGNRVQPVSPTDDNASAWPEGVTDEYVRSAPMWDRCSELGVGHRADRGDRASHNPQEKD